MFFKGLKKQGKNRVKGLLNRGRMRGNKRWVMNPILSKKN